MKDIYLEEINNLEIKLSDIQEQRKSIKRVFKSQDEMLLGEQKIIENAIRELKNQYTICGVYCFRNTKTGEMYVGEAGNVYTRREAHIGARPQWKEYDFFVLTVCNDEDRRYFECLFIALINPSINKTRGYFNTLTKEQQENVLYVESERKKIAPRKFNLWEELPENLKRYVGGLN